MNETRVDMRLTKPEDREKGMHWMQLIFKLNHTMPFTDDYNAILFELFGDRLGEGSVLAAPVVNIVCPDKLTIGRRVYINPGFLAMSRGGITIEDDVQIAANVQLLSNNHDPYDRQILTCKPILIKEGAWIGAGATITAGITIGRYAIVGASAVVTHDVGDYEVVAGSPARVIRVLDPEKFDESRLHYVK
jgi:acetyltransferase-like isoleucine patch superfamily enzyme